MISVSRSALLPYSAEECFRLVQDVSAYPEYLPHCVAADVLEENDQAVLARITFSKAGMTQSLVTRNHLSPFSKIELALHDGPFRHLAGHWEFKPLAESACKVVFAVEFEIEAALASLVADTAINQAAVLAMDAFRLRAEKLYGKRV